MLCEPPAAPFDCQLSGIEEKGKDASVARLEPGEGSRVMVLASWLKTKRVAFVFPSRLLQRKMLIVAMNEAAIV